MRTSHQISHWTTVDDRYILHCDGTISAIAEIEGYDIYMSDEERARQEMSILKNFIDGLPHDVSVEFHLRRRRDKQGINNYMTYPVRRMAEVLQPLRQKYIEHIRDYLFINRIYVVLQWHGARAVFAFGNIFSVNLIEGEIIKSLTNCQKLKKYIIQAQRGLRGFRLLEKEEVLLFLYEAAHYRSCEKPPDTSYLLREILTPSGETRDGFYQMNGITVKPFLLYMYPEPNPRIVTDLIASLPLELDIAFYLRRCDYKSFLRKSGNEEIKQGRQMSEADVESEKRLGDIAAWRRHVVHNNLQIFNNVFYIKLYGSRQEIEEQATDLQEQFAALGAVVESERLIDYAMIYALPGNMYRSNFKRQDHSEMVLSLLPTTKFKQGNGYEEVVAATSFTLTGFDYSNKTGGEFYHSLTIAKTGSGKGVMNCARIIQLYGLGYDFYTIEIGNTYEFLFSLLGGSYISIDPDSSVINPFPPCDEVGGSPSSSLVSPTIKSLTRIFTDGREQMSIHEIVVCEKAFKIIYGQNFIKKHKIKRAPNLSHFHLGLSLLADELLNDKQKYARDLVLKNVNSFLGTIIGERFTRDDNFSLKGTLFGVDFKKLKDDPQLLMVYLTFLSLRYGQKALFSKAPTFIVIDELHEFMRVDKETIQTLCVQIARMGRKERGYINLITQELDDIERLDPSLVNQMYMTNLLYTETKHQAAREHFAGLNDKAFATWSQYQQYYHGYRAGMIGFGGQYYDSFLTYPTEFLALADTRGEILLRKKELMEQHKNIEDAYRNLLLDYAELVQV